MRGRGALAAAGVSLLLAGKQLSFQSRCWCVSGATESLCLILILTSCLLCLVQATSFSLAVTSASRPAGAQRLGDKPDGSEEERFSDVWEALSHTSRPSSDEEDEGAET